MDLMPPRMMVISRREHRELERAPLRAFWLGCVCGLVVALFAFAIAKLAS